MNLPKAWEAIAPGTSEKKDVAVGLKIEGLGNSLVVQWLGLRAFTAKGLGN